MWTSRNRCRLGAPFPSLLFLAIWAVAAWWLKKNIDQGQMDGLKSKHNALEERVRLAEEKALPTVAAGALQTDDKGNVKPPYTPTESEKLEIGQ